MGLTYDISGSQIDGAREYQEDEFLITHLVDEKNLPAALVAVADGMGGHAAGNVASNMAVQSFNKHISAHYPSDSINELLHESVMRANATIAETIAETPALHGMGCTIVAVVLHKETLWWASVGDSHLYLLRGGKLHKKNQDHSYGGFLERMRKAGQELEPQPGLSHNVLMSAITGEDIIEVDCPEESMGLISGDRLILCSDGLDTLNEAKILQYSKWGSSPKECVDQLLQGVNHENKPRQDNTTVVVIDVHSDREIMQTKATTLPKRTLLTEDYEATQRLSAADRRKYFEIMYRKAASAADRRRPPGTAAAKSPLPYILGGGLLLLLLAGGVYLLQDHIRAALERVSAPGGVSSEPADLEFEPDPEEQEAGPGGTDLSATGAAAEPSERGEPVAEAVPEIRPAPPPDRLQTFRDPLKSGGMGPEMVQIGSGSFRMGGFSILRPEQNPEHVVQIPGFALSRRELTIGEYLRFTRAARRPDPPIQPAKLEKQDLPVYNISWQNAVDYTLWLSEQTGHSYRLPSEAEWEYAASTGSRRFYWWGEQMEMNRARCAIGCTSAFSDITGPLPTGSFEPNLYGLYDTAGNVSEWVEDCWHASYQGAPVDGSAWKDERCRQRVTRGGSFRSPSGSLGTRRRTHRSYSTQPYMDTGFRVARDRQ